MQNSNGSSGCRSAVGEALKVNTSLKLLFLGGNNIDDVGAAEICEGLTKLGRKV